MMNWVIKYSVRTRLLLLCIAAVIGMGVVNLLSLRDLRSTLLEDRKSKIKSQVETAVGVVEHYRALSKAGSLPDAEARKAAVEALRKVRFDKSEYFFIFNTEFVYQLLDPKPEREGKSFADLKDSSGKLILVEMNKAAAQGGGFVDYEFPRVGSDHPEPKLSYAAPVQEWNWVVGTGVYIDDLDQAFWSRAGWSLAQLGVLLAILLSFAWFITGSVLRQLGGEPKLGIEIMNQIAEGNLCVDVSKAPSGSMLGALNTMLTALRGMIGEILENSTRLHQQAVHIAESSQEISLAAGRQADATTSMAAAMEELTVSISHISDNSATTELASREAAGLSKQGVEQIEETSSSIQEISSSVSEASQQIRLLNETAREISGIAAVIKEIAGQTNLLALNASIEAARAGEQGRGFAVVADEVGKLAERTASATVDIEKMLVSVQSETEEVVRAMDAALPQVEQGVKLTRGIADLLEKINRGAEETLGHLADVASATREQSAASSGIAVQVEDISQMAEETSSTVIQAEEAARNVETISLNLKTIVSRFRV